MAVFVCVCVCVFSDQLSRLHMILKPFMLRRVKKDVENEMSDKVTSSVSMIKYCCTSVPPMLCRAILHHYYHCTVLTLYNTLVLLCSYLLFIQLLSNGVWCATTSWQSHRFVQLLYGADLSLFIVFLFLYILCHYLWIISI